MELTLLLKALVLGIVEGLTEFLPISSTGHLILVGDLLNFNDERGQVFEIVIQMGAILAVIWEYRAKFLTVAARFFSDPESRRFVANLAIAFMPAAIFGVAFAKYIKSHLFKPIPVAVALIVGGVLILLAERRRHRVRIERADAMQWTDALKVGLAQCFALFPGTSRSAATIIGGLFFGLSRKAATEFSFFLAVPTLIGAGVYQLYHERANLSLADAGMFSVGSAAAFVSAFLCVRWLLRYIATHDFTAFAWYRIAFGLMVLITGYAGVINWTGG
ncbi:MAG: undecaprenyl-diphosphate phosphatase [Bryobacteraceae bacterium]|nr:undecaprenyl-diphosphate phosphatase [Bryobacteraceae bacterium]